MSCGPPLSVHQTCQLRPCACMRLLQHKHVYVSDNMGNGQSNDKMTLVKKETFDYINSKATSKQK